MFHIPVKVVPSGYKTQSAGTSIEAEWVQFELWRRMTPGQKEAFFRRVAKANKAENAGLLVVPVSAHNTSQDCSSCGEKVPKKLHIRWHDCPHCGCSLDRDHNAAVNIKNRAVGQSVLKAQPMSEALFWSR